MTKTTMRLMAGGTNTWQGGTNTMTWRSAEDIAESKRRRAENARKWQRQQKEAKTREQPSAAESGKKA